MTIDDRTEWLEADGRGGCASGTVAGIRTRRYHALLLTATTPPTGRVVLLNGVDVHIETAAGTFALSSQRYTPVTPRGCPFQAWSLGELFRLDREILAVPVSKPLERIS